MARFNRFARFQARCVECGSTTTKAYARANNGKCKCCVTGIAPSPKVGHSYDAIAREGGYEDTMGVSPDALEAYRCGGYYGD